MSDLVNLENFHFFGFLAKIGTKIGLEHWNRHWNWKNKTLKFFQWNWAKTLKLKKLKKKSKKFSGSIRIKNFQWNKACSTLLKFFRAWDFFRIFFFIVFPEKKNPIFQGFSKNHKNIFIQWKNFINDFTTLITPKIGRKWKNQKMKIYQLACFLNF